MDIENLEHGQLLEKNVSQSKYDLVVTYYRSLGLDPYKLKGAGGAVLRAKVKNSPAFNTWVKNRQFQEGVEELDEAKSSKKVDNILKASKRSKSPDVKFFITGFKTAKKKSNQNSSDDDI